MDEQLKREIEVNRDERNHLWALLLLSLGGSFSLIFSSANWIKISFGISGIIFSMAVFMCYLNKSISIDELIKKAKEKH